MFDFLSRFVDSRCAEYVKHMVKCTSDKEQELNKLKSDLRVKKRKAEEDKAIQESRSDPESVTSSLTSDTTGSRRSRNSICRQEQIIDDNERTRKEEESTGSPDTNKKPRIEAGEAATEDSSGEGREAGSGSGSGSGTGSGSGGDPSAQGTSMTKTVSTVSDLTDSNQCSSSNNSGSATASRETEQVPERGTIGEAGEQPSTSSISSDAAVASEKTSRERHSEHKDVVFMNDKRGRKRPPSEVTSLERNFELDYAEVFEKSNIPQLIASTSGKIVTWNECFVQITGYRKSEIERLTIFSLVRPDKLAKFFDIVAAALRSDMNENKSSEHPLPSEKLVDGSTTTIHAEKNETFEKPKVLLSAENAASANEMDHSEIGEAHAIPSRLMDYTAITLPCIDFPAMKKRNESVSDADFLIDPLTVTVTLMADHDPRQRCFHCVFTNCRGTNGALGTITPELLASLFSLPPRHHKNYLPSRRHNKRTRTVGLRFCRIENDISDDEAEAIPPTVPPSSIGGSLTGPHEAVRGDTKEWASK
jgi:PAS domain S-box-containing protein